MSDSTTLSEYAQRRLCQLSSDWGCSTNEVLQIALGIVSCLAEALEVDPEAGFVEVTDVNDFRFPLL